VTTAAAERRCINCCTIINCTSNIYKYRLLSLAFSVNGHLHNRISISYSKARDTFTTWRRSRVSMTRTRLVSNRRTWQHVKIKSSAWLAEQHMHDWQWPISICVTDRTDTNRLLIQCETSMKGCPVDDVQYYALWILETKRMQSIMHTSTNNYTVNPFVLHHVQQSAIATHRTYLAHSTVASQCYTSGHYSNRKFSMYSRSALWPDLLSITHKLRNGSQPVDSTAISSRKRR